MCLPTIASYEATRCRISVSVVARGQGRGLREKETAPDGRRRNNPSGARRGCSCRQRCGGHLTPPSGWTCAMTTREGSPSAAASLRTVEGCGWIRPASMCTIVVFETPARVARSCCESTCSARSSRRPIGLSLSRTAALQRGVLHHETVPSLNHRTVAGRFAPSGVSGSGGSPHAWVDRVDGPPAVGATVDHPTRDAVQLGILQRLVRPTERTWVGHERAEALGRHPAGSCRSE
jgi:hypothetical protein